MSILVSLHSDLSCIGQIILSRSTMTALVHLDSLLKPQVGQQALVLQRFASDRGGFVVQQPCGDSRSFIAVTIFSDHTICHHSLQVQLAADDFISVAILLVHVNSMRQGPMTDSKFPPLWLLCKISACS